MTATPPPPTASSSSSSNADTVKLGDVVTVTGTAGENQGQTQISAATVGHRCGTGR